MTRNGLAARNNRDQATSNDRCINNRQVVDCSMNSIWKNHQYYLLLLVLFFTLYLDFLSFQSNLNIKLNLFNFPPSKNLPKKFFWSPISFIQNCNFHSCDGLLLMYMSRVHNYVMAQDLTILLSHSWYPSEYLTLWDWRLMFLLARQFLFLFCRMWSVWCGMRGFSQECFYFRELTWTAESLKCEGTALLTSRYQQSNYILSSTS